MMKSVLINACLAPFMPVSVRATLDTCLFGEQPKRIRIGRTQTQILTQIFPLNVRLCSAHGPLGSTMSHFAVFVSWNLGEWALSLRRKSTNGTRLGWTPKDCVTIIVII